MCIRCTRCRLSLNLATTACPPNPTLAQRLMDICAKKQHPNALFQAALREPDPAERNRLILIAVQKRSQTAC